MAAHYRSEFTARGHYHPVACCNRKSRPARVSGRNRISFWHSAVARGLEAILWSPSNFFGASVAGSGSRSLSGRHINNAAYSQGLNGSSFLRDPGKEKPDFCSFEQCIPGWGQIIPCNYWGNFIPVIGSGSLIEFERRDGKSERSRDWSLFNGLVIHP